MPDVNFVHDERELIIIDNQNVGVLVLENNGNVLTNIRIDEGKRGRGYARTAMESWADKCRSEGFDYAYVANVNHGATEHIIQTFNYPTKIVDQKKVPADVRPGPHISHICYQIDLNS